MSNFCSLTTDDESLIAFELCSRLEGIIPALEPAHALHITGKLATERKGQITEGLRIAENQKMVVQYLSGKDKLLGFFVGQAMKKSKGKANPKILNEILKEKLSKKN